jgi:hypothetical protein
LHVGDHQSSHDRVHKGRVVLRTGRVAAGQTRFPTRKCRKRSLWPGQPLLAEDRMLAPRRHRDLHSPTPQGFDSFSGGLAHSPSEVSLCYSKKTRNPGANFPSRAGKAQPHAIAGFSRGLPTLPDAAIDERVGHLSRAGALTIA